MFSKKPVEEQKPRKISKWIAGTITFWMIILSLLLFIMAGCAFFFTIVIGGVVNLETALISFRESGYYRTAAQEEADPDYDEALGKSANDERINGYMATFLNGFVMADYAVIFEPVEDGAEVRYLAYSDNYEGRKYERREKVPYKELPSCARNVLKQLYGQKLTYEEAENIFDGSTSIDEVLGAVCDPDGFVIGVIYVDNGFEPLITASALIAFVMILVLAVFIVIITLRIQQSMYKRVTKPIMAIAKGVENYENGKISLDYRPFKRNDELFRLARSFEQMAGRIEDYTQQVAQNAADKERQKVELSTAMNIQNSMLPNNFKEVSGGQPFDICASMKPAKEVGGDFYDFFMTDKDTLWLVMADVSGKGIPGAMFMSVCCTIIRNCVSEKAIPGEIMNSLNESICLRNEEGMFVTVWLAKYTVSEGIMEYCNAGHEYPAIYRKETGSFELQIEDHDIPCGVMESTEYETRSVKIDDGDRIFVYTDGITEAMDVDGNEYGEERMIDALNLADAQDPDTLIEYMEASVKGFTGGAEQSDDLTMMSVYF